MLGVQSWYTALAIPTVAIGGFVATRKRLAYQWREELMDPDGTAYPSVTDADMDFFRRVSPASAVVAAEALAAPLQNRRETSGSGTPESAAAAEDAYGVPLSAKDNIGLSVKSGVLPPETCNALLNEVQAWSRALGNPFDPRKIAALEQSVRLAESRESVAGDGQGAAGTSAASREPRKRLSFDFLSRTQVVADHAEDVQPMKAPWGSGDRIQLEEMPAALRYLVDHTRHAFEGIGRLRHVYIEYSPTGQFFRAPRPPKSYDGHDYVVIPLRRDGRDTVVTMSPVLRSRVSDLREVLRYSWTNRDVDALVPRGCMLRVYGTARYEWGWGVRSGPAWFGSRLNPVWPAEDAAGPSDAAAVGLWGRLKRAAWPPLRLHRDSPTLSAPLSEAAADAALVVLHYEGPRSSGKQRSLLLQPESLIFGSAPTVETFDTWYEDRPSAESVGETGVLRFLIRSYVDMLTMS
ncbi:hypothetical protein NESM_000192500 [Novymonas esmeraldas]|uniref:Uncharacterized protein n=1 Tax=Novymonas esmeraldas TaxID=1808958 RepID=A0AAW0F7Q0_9TRYP